MTDSYFTLLELPPSPTVEESVLRQHYFTAQRQFHPDKAKDAAERLRFLQRAADINAAYHTLKDPLARLYYVLKLRGHDVLQESPPRPASPALLMEMMALQEERSELTSDTEKETFAQKLSQHMTALCTQCMEAINADNMEAAVEIALKLRYIQRMVRSV